MKSKKFYYVFNIYNYRFYNEKSFFFRFFNLSDMCVCVCERERERGQN